MSFHNRHDLNVHVLVGDGVCVYMYAGESAQTNASHRFVKKLL